MTMLRGPVPSSYMVWHFQVSLNYYILEPPQTYKKYDKEPRKHPTTPTSL